jgi:hypothetical protein
MNLEKTYFSSITLPVHQNSQLRRLVTVVSVTSASPFQLLRHQRNLRQQTKRMAVTRGQVQAVNPDVQEVPFCVAWAVWSGIVMMKQLAWTLSEDCIMKLQQNFTVQCRIHIFIMLLKMG